MYTSISSKKKKSNTLTHTVDRVEEQSLRHWLRPRFGSGKKAGSHVDVSKKWN